MRGKLEKDGETGETRGRGEEKLYLLAVKDLSVPPPANPYSPTWSEMLKKNEKKGQKTWWWRGSLPWGRRVVPWLKRTIPCETSYIKVAERTQGGGDANPR